MSSNENSHEIKIVITSAEENNAKSTSSDNGSISNVPDLLLDSENDDSDIQSIKTERRKSFDATQMMNGFDPISSRVPSFMSLGYLDGAVILEEISNDKTGIWYILINLKWENILMRHSFFQAEIDRFLWFNSLERFHLLEPDYR